MAASTIGAKSAQTNCANDNGAPVVPICSGIRPRNANIEAEATVRDHRQIFARAMEQIEALPADASAAERCGLIAIVNASWALLPRNTLRLLISDKHLARQQWREAYFRLAVAKAERDLAWSRWNLASVRNETVRGDLLDRRRGVTFDNWVRATGELIEVPATTRHQITQKRRFAGRWLSGRPDWQRMLDQDEARLPRKPRGKSD